MSEKNISNAPLYQTEFPCFDSDLAPILQQLPVKFIDHSWHHDACPRFEYAQSDDIDAYPRLVLWIDYEDIAARAGTQRFTLQIVRCAADEAELLAADDQLEPIVAAISQAINDGVTMRMHKVENFEGKPCLCVHYEGTDIENPFLSECGRFFVSPAIYGLDLVSGSIFLRAMPLDQLRDVMSNAIGNRETFDGCTSDEAKRQFAVDYLAAVLQEATAVVERRND